MKKIFLFAAIVCFTSFNMIACASDDENSPEETENSITIDPIIGVWNVFSQNGKEVSPCVQEGTIEFKENGEFVITVKRELVTGTNKCIDIEPVNGTWKKVRDNQYAAKTGGVTDNFTTIFSNNNKTLQTSLLGVDRVYKKK